MEKKRTIGGLNLVGGGIRSKLHTASSIPSVLLQHHREEIVRLEKELVSGVEKISELKAHEREAVEKIQKILEPLPIEKQKELLLSIADLESRKTLEKIAGIKDAIGKSQKLANVMHVNRDELVANLKEQETHHLTLLDRYKLAGEWLGELGPEDSAKVLAALAHIKKAVKEIVYPPNLKTPGNVEVMLMGTIYVCRPLLDDNESVLQNDNFGVLTKIERDRTPHLDRFLKTASFTEHEHADSILGFGNEWMNSSFARLEVGHKLAAALALTDVPDDVEVKAPWGAWSLTVPDDTIFEKTSVRLWCMGSEPVFMVDSIGEITRIEGLYKSALAERETAPGARSLVAVYNLVRGCCLALSNPEEFRRDRQRDKPSGSSKNSRHGGPPELTQARFLLSKPLEIDLREELSKTIRGERQGGSPKVQFLVRGHWRNQSYGPGHTLRRPTWIQPFWKGPKETRVLLRNAKVKDS